MCPSRPSAGSVVALIWDRALSAPWSDDDAARLSNWIVVAAMRDSNDYRRSFPASNEEAMSKPRVSFELYPPRNAVTEEAVWSTVRGLEAFSPRCLSVTYPSNADGRAASRALIGRLLAETSVPPVAHLTVVGASRGELRAKVRELLTAGVRDFLALRGDAAPGQEWEPHPDGLNYAADLVALIRGVEAELRADGVDLGTVDVGCAVYPHAGAESRMREFRAMRAKQVAGASFSITQVFYRAAEYGALLSGAPAAGVSIPIMPGVIPFTDPARLERLAKLTGVAVPDHVRALADIADPQERFDRGIQLTADLVEETLAQGAPGIHIFTFNQLEPAAALTAELIRRGLIAAPTPLKGQS